MYQKNSLNYLYQIFLFIYLKKIGIRKFIINNNDTNCHFTTRI